MLGPLVFFGQGIFDFFMGKKTNIHNYSDLTVTLSLIFYKKIGKKSHNWIVLKKSQLYP